MFSKSKTLFLVILVCSGSLIWAEIFFGGILIYQLEIAFDFEWILRTHNRSAVPNKHELVDREHVF